MRFNDGQISEMPASWFLRKQTNSVYQNICNRFENSSCPPSRYWCRYETLLPKNCMIVACWHWKQLRGRDNQRSSVFLRQERNSLIISREELEHELDSKNHTIRMLQKQLVSELLSELENEGFGWPCKNCHNLAIRALLEPLFAPKSFPVFAR